MSADRSRISILQLAWPILVENLLRVSLMGVDTVMLGHYSGKAVAAMSLVAQFGFFVQLLYLVVSSGASILITQNLGAGRRREAGLVGVGSLTLLVAFSLVVSAGVALIARPLLHLYELEPEVEDMAFFFSALPGDGRPRVGLEQGTEGEEAGHEVPRRSGVRRRGRRRAPGDRRLHPFAEPRPLDFLHAGHLERGAQGHEPLGARVAVAGPCGMWSCEVGLLRIKLLWLLRCSGRLSGREAGTPAAPLEEEVARRPLPRFGGWPQGQTFRGSAPGACLPRGGVTAAQLLEQLQGRHHQHVPPAHGPLHAVRELPVVAPTQPRRWCRGRRRKHLRHR